MKKYLLDTNAIIYALNKGFKFPKNIYLVSIITEIELTTNIKEETIKIRQKSKIKLPDSIIIATAIDQNAILITSDKQLINSQIIETIALEQLQ